jgi:uncharacterized protein YndB with AHSA1/START domain
MTQKHPMTAGQAETGTLERAGHRWRLRFTRRLAHRAEKVWRAVTDPEHLLAWFPDRMTGELTVGATLRFESEYVDGGFFEGRVLVVDEPRALEFTWGTDVIRIEIEPAGDGCVLTLLDTIDEVGKAARDGAGWHVCLDKLEHHLAGDRPAWSHGDRWGEVHPAYVEALGPAAATIGPPATA